MAGHKVGIDVRTKDVAKLRSRLLRLKGTVGVSEGTPYWMDGSISQMHYVGDKAELALDTWLYEENRDVEYLGTFPMEVHV